ncbi:MAG: peptidase, partial [Chloroflexi bacterium]|nr:peptidase [Chloroflexota bacterium]
MAGGEPQKLPWGLAHAISWGPQQGVVLGRSGVDPAQWKRYRGGRAGEIWVDETGTGEFRRLELAGNPVDPLWIRERIYFISDHEGIGNVYSCRPDGQDRRQHTQHREFYARNAATDGRRIVYHAGADIYLLDPQTDEHIRVEISCAGSQTQRQPRFVEAGQYLEDYELSPDGSTLALVCRGKSFTLGNWEGPVVQQGRRHGVRYRLVRWLRDGQHLVMVSDEGGEERLELYQAGASAPVQRFADVDIGRPYEVHVSLARNEIVLFNHRHELLWVNLDTGEARVIEHHQCDILAGLEWVPDGRCSWSPDGNWIAYAAAVNHQVRIIKVYNVETGATHAVTEPVLQDFAPVFDPAGRYLYFLSTRIFNPVWNQVHFGLDFPRGMRPYLVTLRRNEPSPFVPRPRGLADDQSLDSAAPVGKITIDFDGISERIVPLPVA